MGFDIGAGFSEMGKNVAAQAGTEALSLQRSQLEQQKDMLASQLAEGRETRLAGVKAGYDTALNTRRDTAAMDRLNVSEAGQDRRQGEQHKIRLDEISAQSKAQLNVAVAEHGLQASDLSWVETDDSTGKRFGVTKNGQKVDLGITGPNADDEKLLTRAERFSLVKKTVVDPETGEKTTQETIDPAKASDFLSRQGRDDLAKGYAKPAAPVAPAAPKGVPPGSQYSPSRKQWRDAKGKLYDASGAPVGGGASADDTGLINMPAPGL